MVRWMSPRPCATSTRPRQRCEGIVVLGSLGENQSLTADEKRELVAVTVATMLGACRCLPAPQKRARRWHAPLRVTLRSSASAG